MKKEQPSAAEQVALMKRLYSPKARPEKFSTCERCDGSGGKDGRWCMACNGIGKVEVGHAHR